jgi:hypothetical protein
MERTGTMRTDGIREQIEILGELSRALDEYFVLRTAPPDRMNSR